MKTYFELQIPLTYNADWLKEIRTEFQNIPVIWQKGYFHITVAFLNDTPLGVDVRKIIDETLSNVRELKVRYDKMDAFTITSGAMHIIYLTVTDVPDEVKRLISSVRDSLARVCPQLEPDFKLHVTLGRVYASEISLYNLQNRLYQLTQPSYETIISDAEYREFRGKVIKHWRFL